MTCPVNTIDSNATGLRFAKEQCLKILPTTPVWKQQEPNTYSSFGAKTTTVARDPINPSRQNQKGVLTDLTADAGYNQDFTLANSQDLLQGFLLANAREKPTTASLNATAIAVTSVTASTKTYGAASGLSGYKAGAIILASGFTTSTNNGIKTLASNSTSTSVVVNETVADETPSATAKFLQVGAVLPSADAAIAMNGTLVRLTTSSTDLSSFGLIVGEWIFVGGDSSASAFNNNFGFARIGSIAAGYLEFDKVSWPNPVDESGSAKTIQLFFGTVIRNELDPTLIVRSSYQFERTLGNDADGIMSQYVIGAVPNDLTLNLKNASKITTDLTFMGCDEEHRTGLVGLKSGLRPTLPITNAFNTTSDARVGISLVQGVAAPVRLFAFITDLTLKINNNVSSNKAISVLGAFEQTMGVFDVQGDITAYFSNVTALDAVRNNADVTIDVTMIHNQKGVIWDLPLVTLGDGLLAVVKDKPITLPLKQMAAQSAAGHTLLVMVFNYLPSIAT